MLGVFFQFDVRTREGTALRVEVLEPKLVTVNDTEPRIVRFEVFNPMDRIVSLSSFKASIRGPETTHVMVAVSDPIPFDVPAHDSKIGHIELTALAAWPHRVNQTAILTSREHAA